MHWQIKAAIQKVLSGLPFAGSINYFLQTRISRNLPVSQEIFEEKAANAQKHWQALTSHFATPPARARIYEFGGGYDMLVPLHLYTLGARQQTVTDIQPLVKYPLVNNALQRLSLPNTVKSAAELEQRFGIQYTAPLHPARTELQNDSVDFIHSTDTMEHIPARQLLPLLRECHRLLAPGGIISCIIDLQDHYQYFDKNISPFNFYRYSPTVWKLLYNNRLQYQNRLRNSDYTALLEHAGFTVISDEAQYAPIQSLNLFIHPVFTHYPQKDLLAHRVHIVAMKQ